MGLLSVSEDRTLLGGWEPLIKSCPLSVSLRHGHCLLLLPTFKVLVWWSQAECCLHQHFHAHNKSVNTLSFSLPSFPSLPPPSPGVVQSPSSLSVSTSGVGYGSERLFPPNNGLTFSCWFYISRFILFYSFKADTFSFY